MFSTLNVSTFLLAFIPACINIGIFFYLLLFMPKGKLTNIFSLLLLAVLALQLEDSILRLNISVELARYVDKILSLGWLAIGVLALHFSMIFSGYKISNSRIFYITLYGPLIVFFSIYHANTTPIPIVENESWGYLINLRPHTTDLIQRYWLAGLTYISMLILFRFAFSKKREIQKRKQAMLIAVGMLIPGIQGGITQIALPMMGHFEIPITSAFLTFLSVAIIIALKRYSLFNISESIDLDKVLNELNSMVFFISTDQKILYMNTSSKKIFLNEENNSSLYLEQIFSTKIDYDKFCDQNCQNGLLKVKKPLRHFETTFINHEKDHIHVLFNSQPIYNNRKFQGIMIFANDITTRKKHVTKIEDQNKRLNEIAWHHSHILRAPLARIMAISSLLQTENQTKKETSTLLNAIHESCAELDVVVRDINKRAENVKY
jgi:PAS domain-containing protein